VKADVVVVTYNSEATVAAAIGSVIDDPLVEDVVVVDNLSSDRSAAVAEGLGARVVRSPVNSGFGAGCNLGVGRCGSDWVLLLNPDACMEPGSLGGMLAYGAARPDVGVVASDVRGPRGRPEPVRRRFPAWWRAFAEPGVAARWDEAHYRRKRGAGGGAVDWVSASAVLVRRSAFDAVGGFDEGFFLYAEEVDLCARLRRAGYATHWVRGFPSTHRPGSSTGHLPAMGKVEWARGCRRYIAKHAARPALLQTSYLVGLWGRALVWTARGEPETAHKWRAAARAIRAG
jgi:N-acetylglucosaminyl-diphospho-decaprenol L-rhamnosyltransferase